MHPTSLYLHIPFCKHRCGYCDFNTYAGMERFIPVYIMALCAEIDCVGSALPEPVEVHTVFFGGGTPSLLTPGHIDQVLGTIRARFDVRADAEISLEANPGTLMPDQLNGYRACGVNRLSLGVQSTNLEELRLLERIHGLEDVVNSVEWARAAGFDNISLDLIFGLPGQDLKSWQETMAYAVQLGVEHLSLYGLTIEEGTPLKAMVERGVYPHPDDDLAADMYEAAMDYLAGRGFLHYEISNWAKKRGQQWMTCQHNLQYWRNLPYFGFGAGAHAYHSGRRAANVPGIVAYIERIRQGVFSFPEGPAVESSIMIDRKAEMQETMMVGLRLLVEGVSRAGFEKRFGIAIERVFGAEIDELTRLGLIEGGETIRLTRRGCMVGNQVFMRFVGE